MVLVFSYNWLESGNEQLLVAITFCMHISGESDGSNEQDNRAFFSSDVRCWRTGEERVG